jgi:hypothetical protein
MHSGQSFADPQVLRIMRKILGAAVLFFVGLVLWGANSAAYFLRSDADGDALWNSHEAYFFVHVQSKGVTVNGLLLPFFLASEYLGGVAQPDDIRESVVVIHVTPSEVDHHVIERSNSLRSTGPDRYKIIDGRIWANYPALGGLCWWTGERFEAVPQEVLTKLRLDRVT